MQKVSLDPEGGANSAINTAVAGASDMAAAGALAPDVAAAGAPDVALAAPDAVVSSLALDMTVAAPDVAGAEGWVKAGCEI